MSRLQIPYDKVIINPTDFEPENFDSTMRQLLDKSSNVPVVVEIFNEYIQYLLFIRDGQFYWACTSGPDCFEGLSIRDFFSRLQRTQYPKVVAYETNILLYHSLLVFIQKKPDLKVSSSLVDLDDLLDRTEKEQSNSLITALQPNNFMMLRYKESKPVACYHGMVNRSKTPDKREEFLVKIYTLTTHAIFEINLFTDLVVTHSEDARRIPPEYQGSIVSFFMSQPPKLIVKLKDRPLKTYTFSGKQLTIGRLPDNDIVIDNLSVSRKHAVIHAWKSGYHIKDLGSKNHTYLNGQQVDSDELKNGDRITIGKYQIHFQIPAGDEVQGNNLDQTVIIPNFHSAPSRAISARSNDAAPGLPPKLFRRSDQEEYVLNTESTIIGKSSDSDIRLNGLFSPRVRAEINRCGSDYIIRKASGRRDISINGEKMNEKVLEEEDLIAIGAEEFVFKR
ncbi:MAG: FHA domain-containing protein [Candidatus Krumholzibacteriota bacterium]|nr:FHA domain-containing protein [Candidatus Krumholzibacteriota bacterium]